MRKLRLYFHSQELIEVTFQESAQAKPQRVVRGKTSGAICRVGSFQWTSAVKALSLLISKAALSPNSSKISGASGSLAASLDYALSKQPIWICEMFGCDAAGSSYARRFILRTNPERKRAGPVVLGISPVYFPAGSIEVHLDGSLASPAQLAELVARLSDTPSETALPQEAVAGIVETKMASNE
jgi:hypothetical protein